MRASRSRPRSPIIPARSSPTRSPMGLPSGWRCCTCWPAPRRRMAERAGATIERPGERTSEIGRLVRELEISRAWLVDPVADREGPGEIVVSDGRLEAVTWLDAAEGEGVTPDGV